MSADDIKLVEETLTGLMVSDNTIRKAAEQKLEEFQSNKPLLIFCLSSVLLGKIYI
jgi:hypothetical protein